MNRITRMRKWYTWIVVLFPVLILYESLIPMITLIELIAIAYCVVAFLVSGNQLHIEAGTLLFSLFLLAITLFQLIFISNEQFVDAFGTALRYIMMIAFMALFNNTYFSAEYGIRALRIVAIVATIYIVIQTLLYSIMGIMLPGGLPYLPTVRPEMRTYIDDVRRYGYAYRPRSIFGEPAHYAQYVLLAILLEIFNERKKVNWSYALFLCLGVICSMSTLGILSMVLVASMYCLNAFLRNDLRSKLRIILLLVLLVPIIIIFIGSVPQIRSIIETKFLRTGGLFSDERFESLVLFDGMLKNTRTLVLGAGMASAGSFIVSYPLWLYSFGVTGCGALVIYLIYVYKSSNLLAKAAIWLFLFECIGSELLLGKYFYFYFSFILINKRVVKMSDEQDEELRIYIKQ